MLMLKFLLVILTFACFVLPSAVGQVSVGVKAGDWVEYTVSTTGVPVEGHDVVWARMEILSVQDAEVTVNVTTQATNGTYSSVIMTLNLADGTVDMWAIIPSNLNVGDSFYDKTRGNIPIMGEEQKTFGGVVRDTTYYNSTERFKRWDKVTGIFLEGTDKLETYSLTAVFENTNIWSPTPVGPVAAYALLVIVFIIASVLMIIAIERKHKEETQQKVMI